MYSLKNAVFLFSLVLGSLAYGAPPAQIAIAPSAKIENISTLPTEEKSSAIASELKAEIKILKAQNKLIRDYQGAMADTVYWALGIISGVFAILMSYSIFTNFRFYEQDKARLKSELDNVINSFKSELLIKFEQDKNDLERSFDTRNEANMKIVLDQGAEGRARVDAIRTELQSKLDDAINKFNPYEEKLSMFSKRSHQIEYELRTVEEHVWELKNVPDCILLTQCQGVRSSKDGSFDFATSSVLKRMKDTIKKHYIDKNRLLKPAMIKRIEEALVIADNMEPQVIQEIRHNLEVASNIVDPTLMNAADLGDLP